MFEEEIDKTLKHFKAHDIELRSGLSAIELKKIEKLYRISFPPDLRALLTVAVPLAPDYYNWADFSHENMASIRSRLVQPIEGILFDIEHNDFWMEHHWGRKPVLLREQLSIAKSYLARVPRLIPLCSHRYISSYPKEASNPVFSVHQTDIIHYGNNLWHYFEYEPGRVDNKLDWSIIKAIPFWSELATT